MRIGEAASRTGLSARMIRYYEQRGVVRSARARDGHRRYTDDDVRRLRRLRALLAANIAPEWAERAIDADLPDHERRQLRRALELLIGEAQEAHARLDPGPEHDADDEPPEQRISLMFDTFMMRTRMESVLTAALQPAGIRSGDYAVVSLIAVEGSMTPATLARLVGVAPSSLVGRVDRLLRWGWIQRHPAPEDPRSWRLELTPTGVEVLQAALPHAGACAQRIDAALKERGVEPDSIRAGLITLSTALRNLLPDNR
jgi:DNA-binding transcriptional MerR regulator/DNA-binding MarR family transcriptional regulator